MIVAGVLVALWVNAGWEGIQDRRAESVLLEDLITDFELNLTQIDEIIAFNETSPDLSMKMLEDGISKIPEDSTITYFLSAFWSPEFVPHKGALESALTSGSFHLIRNTELRQLLASWNSTNASFLSSYQKTLDLNWEIMRAHPEEQMALFYSQIEGSGIELGLYQYLLQEAFGDQEIRKKIAVKSMNVRTTEPSIQALRDDTANLLILLKQ